MLHGRFDIRDLLAFIAPHEEHARCNPVRFAESNGSLNLFHRNPALHRIEDLLRAAFRPDPDSRATELTEQARNFLVDSISPRDALERYVDIAPIHLGGKRVEPAVVN